MLDEPDPDAASEPSSASQQASSRGTSSCHANLSPLRDKMRRRRSPSPGLRLSLVSFHPEPVFINNDSTVSTHDDAFCPLIDSGGHRSQRSSSTGRRRATYVSLVDPEPTQPKLMRTSSPKRSTNNSLATYFDTEMDNDDNHRDEDMDQDENQDVLSELRVPTAAARKSYGPNMRRSFDTSGSGNHPTVQQRTSSTPPVGVSPSATGRMPHARTSTPIVSSSTRNNRSSLIHGPDVSTDPRRSRSATRGLRFNSTGGLGTSSPFATSSSDVHQVSSASNSSHFNPDSNSTSDANNENQYPNDSSIANSLMRYRRTTTGGTPGRGPSSGSQTRSRRGAGSSPLGSTTPLSSITTQSSPSDAMNRGFMSSKPSGFWSSFLSSSSSSSSSLSSSSSTGSYNWISCSILICILVLFGSVISYYVYARFNASNQSSSPVVPSSADSTPSEKVMLMDSDLELLATKIKKVLCSDPASNPVHCIKDRESVIMALHVVNLIHGYLEKGLIEFNCGSKNGEEGDHIQMRSDPSIVSIEDMKKELMEEITKSAFITANLKSKPGSSDQQELPDFGQERLEVSKKAFNDAMTLIQGNADRFKMMLLTDLKSSSNQKSHIRIDPNNFPAKYPVMCKIWMGIYNFFMVTFVVMFVLLIAVAIFYFMNIHRKKKSAEEDLFYDLIEKSLELLQSPDEPQSMPIYHIRDTLLSPVERKDKKILRIWDRVVNHIENSESRVSCSREEIEGENYKTWKWVASPSVSLMEGSLLGSQRSDPSVIRTGVIEWQGQAFGEGQVASGSSRRSRLSSPANSILGADDDLSMTDTSFTAPTAFLKIRNMFAPETVQNKGVVFKAEIKNAIIEKCLRKLGPDAKSGHGILHIEVDQEHAKEGLVFMRCQNLSSASNAYLALHGWWCEKRLVSVRFLHSNRYFMRFPEAENVLQELQLERIVSLEDANDDSTADDGSVAGHVQ